MNGSSNERASNRVLATLAVETRDVVIILAAFATVAVLSVFVVQHYNAAQDATSVLGVLIPAISTIAGMAFGISVGARAGAAAGDATAAAARTETTAVRTQMQQALTGVAQLQEELQPVLTAAATTELQVPDVQLQAAKTRLDSIEQSLRAAL
jgi:hypothetical protein